MLTRTEVLQGGCNVERSSPSKCTAAVGGHDGKFPVRDGIRVDGEWQYQRVYQGTQGSESVRACKVFHLWTTAVADDPWQLKDIARGLIYIHGQAMIHGDLKGVRF